jgi:galactokinase
LCNEFGAYGAKLTGAGFGGAVVTLVKNDKVEEFKKNILKSYNKAKFI